ncbi:YuiA family protein [Alteribacillus sp. HJP-4]
MKTRNSRPGKACPYCAGKGYQQLLTGGTETCYSCGGDGKNKQYS